MKNISAQIRIGNVSVGAVAWIEKDQLAAFEFAPEYIKNGADLAPITMPLRRSSGKIYTFPELRNLSTFKGLPGLLADLLPDKYGNALVQAWLATQGRSPQDLNPIETLCFIGKRGMGALEIEPSSYPEAAPSGKLELNSLIQIAGKILSDRENFQAYLNPTEQKALSNILKIGTSAGGARPKAIIAYNPNTHEIRSGQVQAPEGFTHWLIKFDGVSEEQFGASTGYGRVEMAYYKMAVDAGIHMMESRLFEENGRAHFMTRRFDRDENGDKIHMQSLCALRHFDFNLTGYFAYEQIFETMRMLGLPYPDAEQLFIRMVFNVLARNCDDHTKNFAFLMNASGTWRLSPGYDICYAYRPGSIWVSKHSLSVNGKREYIKKNDMMEVARQMNIKKAEQIYARVENSVQKWNLFAEEFQVENTLRDLIQKNLNVPA